jgi:hypothetical protein
MADSTCSSRQRLLPAWSSSDADCPSIFKGKKREKKLFFINDSLSNSDTRLSGKNKCIGFFSNLDLPDKRIPVYTG